MGTEGLVLRSTHIRLEPLEYRHVEGLVAASATDPSLYQWSPVPQGKVEATSYVDTALAARDACSAVPFAIIKLNDKLDDRLDDGVDDGVVIGSTRFFNLERWSWPKGHPRHARRDPELGALFDRGSGVASCEATAESVPESSATAFLGKSGKA